MDTTLHQEEENKKKGLIASVIFHGLLVILCIMPFLTFPTPPPGQAGVLVSFGEPDVGQGEEEPGPATTAEVEPVEVEEPPAEPEVETEREVEENPKPKPKDPVKDNTKKVNTDDNSKEIALKKKKDREKKIKDAAEKKAKDAAAAKAAKIAKQKADAAKAAADAKAKKEKEFNDAKNSIGDLFNNGQGSGSGSQGTSGTPGNAGNPDGDPDANRLDGLGKGSGDVSGFGNRGFDRPGAITGNFQEIGTVNIKVCVDGNGKVVSATPKLSGSTTQSSKLQRLAIANAKKYKFDKSDSDTQCGTITYRFKLQ